MKVKLDDRYVLIGEGGKMVAIDEHTYHVFLTDNLNSVHFWNTKQEARDFRTKPAGSRLGYLAVARIRMTIREV